MTLHERHPPIRLLVMEGDGIGPEIVSSTVSVLGAVVKRFGLPIFFETAPVGLSALKQLGTTLPGESLEKARKSDGVILGPVSHNEYPAMMEGGINPSGELRKSLDLYANVRPIRSRTGVPPRCGKSMDLVIVRENTEGFYADRSMFYGSGEFMPTHDTALSVRKITRHASLRIAEVAFGLARKRHKKVAVVHKANVLRTSDGLFLECVREVAGRYGDVVHQEYLVDAMAALLIRDPSVFDVIVTTNMYGDILSDEASEIAGSIGLAGSLNMGTNMAIAQAQHGSAPNLAGQDIANPCSLISSAAMLLDWLGEQHKDPRFTESSAKIDHAINELVAKPEGRTRDMGGRLGTRAFTQLLIDRITR